MAIFSRFRSSPAAKTVRRSPARTASRRVASFEQLEDRHLLSATSQPMPAMDLEPAAAGVTPSAVSTHLWRNPVNFLDVDADGGVDPRDVLLVINALLEHGPHALPSPGAVDEPPPYLDVFPDDRVLVRDVFVLINELVVRAGAEAIGAPNTRITIEGSGFDPQQTTAVWFTTHANHLTPVPALSVSETTVDVVVPPYFDIDNLQFRSGVVSVIVVQDGANGFHPVYDNFLIRDLPLPLPSVGELTSEFLRSLQGFSSLNVRDYQRIGDAAGLSADGDFQEFGLHLHSQLQLLESIRHALDSLIGGDVDAVNLYVDTTDPNQTQFSLTRDWLSVADRQIASWIQRANSHSEAVTVTELRQYFNDFVDDVRAGRATNDPAAVARARESFGEMLEFGAGVLATAVALENAVVSSSLVDVEPAASVQLTLATPAAALLATADLQIAAHEFFGLFEDDYRDTVAELATSGLHQSFEYSASVLGFLTPSPVDGTGADLFGLAVALGESLYAVQDPDPDYLADLGESFADNFAQISVSLDEVSPDVQIVRLDPTAALMTTAAGGSAVFHFQLTTQPQAPVTVFLTSSEPTEAVVTSMITVDPANWMLLHEVVVTGQDDGVSDGTVDYVIQFQTNSIDPAYDGIDLPDLPLVHLDP